MGLIKFFRRRRNAEVRMTCPHDKHDVLVTFESSPGGQRLDVLRCSEFIFPDEVHCDKRCLAPGPPAKIARAVTPA